MNTKLQFKVLWVYQLVKAGHATVKLEAGQKPSLCFRGRKHMYCVSAGHPVRVIKRKVSDFDSLREVQYTAVGNVQQTYPVPRAIEQFEDIASRNGITAGAKAVLERAKNSALAAAFDEEALQDEEDVQMTETPPDAVPETETETKDESQPKETTVKKLIKKNAKTKKAPKAAKVKKVVKAKAPKVPKGPSRISRAVEYMKDEVKKAGGQSKLERGWRKELFVRAGKKFDLNPTTCSIQYNKQVLK